jgi:hypothetical protein
MLLKINKKTYLVLEKRKDVVGVKLLYKKKNFSAQYLNLTKTLYFTIEYPNNTFGHDVIKQSSLND